MGKTEILWRPRPDDLENSHAARFMRRHGISCAKELRQRAAAEPEWFYPALVEDLGVEWCRPFDRLMDASGGLPWTDWFLGGRLNLVQNVLERPVRLGWGNLCALLAEDDEGRAQSLTYLELGKRVNRLAGGLSQLGLGAGEAAGLYLPMGLDVVVALLACLKIGAVPVPVFGGFGPEALASRLQDSKAKVLLTADATRRRGKEIRLKPLADLACAMSPSVRHVVVSRRAGAEVTWVGGRDLDWVELEDAGPEDFPTAALEASARSLILYTSGTTGRPKGAVHTHAGVQVVTAKEVGYHLDVRPGDVLFWLTDMGWMMGPWEVLGGLFHGATVVLLEGAPDYPSPDRLWAMAERHRVTHLGLAPTAVRVLASYGEDWVSKKDLSRLRILGSTGEPWDPDSYRWYFERVGGGRCPVINISGGTELMGCLLAPLSVAPLKACSLQGASLGLDVDVLDEEGRKVRGEVGYLVCRNPAPNMTRGFLNDPERYLETYFSKFGPRIWCHGDWARVDDEGFWFLTGRADDTLKIAGKRVGPGEVEAAAVSHPAVREAAAVGLPDPLKGTKLVLVVTPRPGKNPSRHLSQAVATHVAGLLGPAMRPAEVRWVTALPVTRSGKILRAVIRRVLAGEDPGNLATAANPEAVKALVRRGSRD